MNNDPLGDILHNAPDFSSTEDSASPNAPSDVRFYRRIGTEEAGPYELSELQALIDEGQLHQLDRIRRSDSRCWLPCQEVSELSLERTDPEESEIQAASALIDELFSVAAEAASLPEISTRELSELESADTCSEETASEETLAGPEFETPSDSLAALDFLSSVEEEPLSPVRQKPTAGQSPQPRRETPRVVQPPLWDLEPGEESASEPKRKASGPSSMPSFSLVFILVGLLIVWGLASLWPSGGENGRLAVQGTVSVDGTPISSGSIHFVPDPRTQGPSSAGRIENGQFHIGSEAGPGVGEYRMIVQVGNLFSAQSVPSDQGDKSRQGIAGQRFERSVTTQSDRENLFTFNFSTSDVADQSRRGSGSRVTSSMGRSPRP